MGRRASTEQRSHPLPQDIEMMRLVAELYYLRGHSQPAVAELTGFSISKVSRLLASARDNGIVRITVEPARAELTPMGSELGDRLGVRVHLTAGRATAPTIAARLCGIAAAPFVASLLPVRGVVGIAGGYTVSSLVQALPRLERPGLTILPLIGGWDTRNPHLDTNELVRRMAEPLGATTRLLHAPGLLDSEATKLALLTDSAVISTTRYWERLDVALIGISGGPAARPGYGTVMDRLDEGGRRRLAEKGVVGDIAGYLVRVDGTVVEDDWSRRAIAVPLDLLRRTPTVIAVAAGSNKVEAIVGSCRTGLIRILVTDEPTAEAALRALRAAEPRTARAGVAARGRQAARGAHREGAAI
jgi:DNA-binding transcriptional regulator LsrR (DeoR family)